MPAALLCIDVCAPYRVNGEPARFQSVWLLARAWHAQRSGGEVNAAAVRSVFPAAANLRMLVSRLEDAFEPLSAEAVSQMVDKIIQEQAGANSGYPFVDRDRARCEAVKTRVNELLKLTRTCWKVRTGGFMSESTLRVTPHP